MTRHALAFAVMFLTAVGLATPCGSVDFGAAAAGAFSGANLAAQLRQRQLENQQRQQDIERAQKQSQSMALVGQIIQRLYGSSPGAAAPVLSVPLVLQTLRQIVPNADGDTIADVVAAFAPMIAAQPPAPLQTGPGVARPPVNRGAGDCDSGHWVKSVTDDGDIVTLEDDSVWEIDSIDQVDTALWLPTTEIVTCSDKLINTDDGEKAGARRLR